MSSQVTIILFVMGISNRVRTKAVAIYAWPLLAQKIVPIPAFAKAGFAVYFGRPGCNPGVHTVLASVSGQSGATTCAVGTNAFIKHSHFFAFSA